MANFQRFNFTTWQWENSTDGGSTFSQMGKGVLGGLEANMPAAGIADRIYITSDTMVIYQDNGTSWKAMGGLTIDTPTSGLDIARIKVGDSSSGTTITQPSSGPTDYVTIEDKTGGGYIHHLFGTDGTYVSGGTITSNGDVTITSDRRLKKNIQDVAPLLERLLQIAVVTYEKLDSDDTKYGVVAQEIRELFPEVVHEDCMGYLSVDYPKLAVLAIKGLQEEHRAHQEVLASIQERLDKLEEKQ